MSQGLNLGCQGTSAGAGALSDIDLRDYGHAGTKMAIFVLARVDIDADGNPLHNFDEVPGSVLGRQQGESGTGRTTDPLHSPGVFAVVRIDCEPHSLAGPHIAKLGLFEISGDPEVIERN